MINKLATIIVTDTRFVFSSISQNGWGDTLRALNSQDAPPLVQFAKYGICGVAAVIVQTVIFFALTYTVLPAHESILENGTFVERVVVAGELQAFEKSNAVMAIIANLIAFPFSNLTAYLLNVIWVFTPGKHSRSKEFWLFTGIAFVATLIGLLGGPLLIAWGVSAGISQIGFIATSALVNFACRKLFVFKY